MARQTMRARQIPSFFVEVLIVRLAQHCDIRDRIGKKTFRPHGRPLAESAQEALIGSLPDVRETASRRKARQAMRGRHQAALLVS
jgi:hypothetical protein